MWSQIGLVLLPAAAGMPLQDDVATQTSTHPVERGLPRERPDDPPGTPAQLAAPGTSVLSPGNARLLRSPYFVTQVNVDANGANIPGDAANEPSIAIDPTDSSRMVIGWRQFDTIASNFRQAGWAFTQNGGALWTFPGVLEQNVFRSDPVLGSDATGAFYYNSLKVENGNLTCDIFKSTDGGASWQPGVFAFGGDKQWMAIDKTGGVGHGNIYCSWSVFAGCCGNDVFTRSTDGNVSYTTPAAVPGSPIFGTLDVGPDGDLYVSGADPNDFSRFIVSKSSTAKNPFVTPVFEQSTVVQLGGSVGLSTMGSPNPGGLLGMPDVGADPTGGRDGALYFLCSVDPLGPDPLDLHFVRSLDGGATWSAPVRVNDDGGSSAWQWFGTMAVGPDGRIDAVWNDTRNTGVAHLSQLYHAFSVDGGLTWSANQPVSSAWDSTIGYPNQNKIGDYYDMVSDFSASHLAWAATFNGEQDVYYLRIPH